MSEPSQETPQDMLRVENISKSFTSVRALDDVTMRLGRGEVLGLIGDNGAGKSTLIKILTGFHKPDTGSLSIEGSTVTLRSVSHAQDLGIKAVYQDLALANQLSVFHNMFLNDEVTMRGSPILNNRKMKKKAREYLDEIGVNIPSVNSKVATLSGGQRQSIAVARAVNSNVKILLLDEPLAAMGAKEGALILDFVEKLKDRTGISVILIAHNYAHIFDICDRVNILQGGRITFDKRVGDTSVGEMTDIMVSEYRRARSE